MKRIYNGIDLQRFTPLHCDVLKSKLKGNLFKIKQSDIVITYAGQFIEEKGIKPYIQAVQKLLADHDDLCFVFVGQGPLYDIAFSAITWPYSDHARFLGVRDDMENILRVSDIVVVPSIWEEAFGLVAAEASACGIPIVASNIGGLPELVLNGKTGILSLPGDILSVVMAVEKLLTDSEMRKRFGVEGCSHVEKNFSMKQIVTETLNLYKELD